MSVTIWGCYLLRRMKGSTCHCSPKVMLLKLVQCILATNWGTLPGKSHQWGINKQLTRKMTQLEHTVAVGFSDTLEKKNSLSILENPMHFQKERA